MTFALAAASGSLWANMAVAASRIVNAVHFIFIARDLRGGSSFVGRTYVFQVEHLGEPLIPDYSKATAPGRQVPGSQYLKRHGETVRQAALCVRGSDLVE